MHKSEREVYVPAAASAVGRRLAPVLIIFALLGGFAGYRLDPWRESPRQAWETISRAAAAGDYGAVWDRFDPGSQARMAHTLRRFASKSTDPRRAAGMTDREWFVLMLATQPDARVHYLPGRIVEVQESEDRAMVRLDRPDPMYYGTAPPPNILNFRRFAGRWYLSFGPDPPK